MPAHIETCTDRQKLAAAGIDLPNITVYQITGDRECEVDDAILDLQCQANLSRSEFRRPVRRIGTNNKPFWTSRGYVISRGAASAGCSDGCKPAPVQNSEARS